MNDSGFDFTLTIVMLLFFLRCVEASVILVEIFRFFFKKLNETSCLFRVNYDNIKQLIYNAMEKFVTKFKAICLTMIVILIMILSSAAVVILEVYLGLNNQKETESCRKLIHWLDFVLEIFRYTYDVGIRMLMITATLAVKNIWDINDVREEDDQGNKWITQ